MKKQTTTHFYDYAPNGTLHNESTGYSIGCHWHDNITGYEYIHETDGVWNQIQTIDLTLIALAYSIAL